MHGFMIHEAQDFAILVKLTRWFRTRTILQKMHVESDSNDIFFNHFHNTFYCRTRTNTRISSVRLRLG